MSDFEPVMAPEETTTVPDLAEPLTGRLVLATGTVVEVPAEGISVATHHYDPKFNATVPVVSTFILD